MPKFRCYIPKQSGDDKEAKKTKDGWDAYFVFDGPSAPKGMVCKTIQEKPKTVAAVPLKKAGAAATVGTPAQEQAQGKQAQREQAQKETPAPSAVTETAEAPAGDKTPPPNPPESQAVLAVPADFSPPVGASNPSGLSSDAAIAVVAAMAALVLSGTFSKPNTPSSASAQKGKPSKSKAKKPSPQQEKQARLEQQRQEREKEQKDCSVATETATDAAQAEAQHYDKISDVVSRLSRDLTVLQEEKEDMSFLSDKITTLTQRIAVLELKQKRSSKNDSEPRTARRRRQTLAPQQAPAVGTAPRRPRT